MCCLKRSCAESDQCRVGLPAVSFSLVPIEAFGNAAGIEDPSYICITIFKAQKNEENADEE